MYVYVYVCTPTNIQFILCPHGKQMVYTDQDKPQQLIEISIRLMQSQCQLVILVHDLKKIHRTITGLQLNILALTTIFTQLRWFKAERKNPRTRMMYKLSE